MKQTVMQLSRVSLFEWNERQHMLKKLLGAMTVQLWGFMNHCARNWEYSAVDASGWNFLWTFPPKLQLHESACPHTCTVAHYCMGYCIPEGRAKALLKIWLRRVNQLAHSPFCLLDAVSCHINIRSTDSGEWTELMCQIVTCSSCLFSSVCLTGLHADHVFPTVLEGQTSSLHRDPPQLDPGQQGRRPALGPRHLLPKRQEVFRPRSHRQKPHDPPASRWYRSLWPQVGTCKIAFCQYVCCE